MVSKIWDYIVHQVRQYFLYFKGIELYNVYLECSQSVLNFFILKYIQESKDCFLFTSWVEYPICMTICIRDKILKRRLGIQEKLIDLGYIIGFMYL